MCPPVCEQAIGLYCLSHPVQIAGNEARGWNANACQDYVSSRGRVIGSSAAAATCVASVAGVAVCLQRRVMVPGEAENLEN